MENAGKVCWLDVLDFRSRDREVVGLEVEGSIKIEVDVELFKRKCHTEEDNTEK